MACQTGFGAFKSWLDLSDEGRAERGADCTVVAVRCVLVRVVELGGNDLGGQSGCGADPVS